LRDFEAYFGADPRPVLLVDTNRIVRGVNAAARRHLRSIAEGVDLAERAGTGAAHIDDYLRLCASTRGPVPAALRFFNQDGALVAWHADGGVISPASPEAPALLILRLRSRQDANAGFIALTDQVGHLNAELRHRKQLQQDLETALAAKEVLLSEVNHRVKNNLQIIMGILRLAGGAGNGIFQQTIDRIAAMGKVH
jgi:hypothetical protein